MTDRRVLGMAFKLCRPGQCVSVFAEEQRSDDLALQQQLSFDLDAAICTGKDLGGVPGADAVHTSLAQAV